MVMMTKRGPKPFVSKNKDPAPLRTQEKRTPAEAGAPKSYGSRRLVIAIPTGVISVPPIRITGNNRLSAEPIAVVVGVIPGTVCPDPHAVAEDPMTVQVAEFVTVMLREVLALPIVTLPIVPMARPTIEVAA